jgi:hypothetical protein
MWCCVSGWMTPNILKDGIQERQASASHAHGPYLILCAALIFTYLAAPHLELSAVSYWQRCPLKSPGFTQWQPRYLNLIWPNPQSQRCISDACLYLSHSGLCTSPSLNRCPFKLQCPVNIPVTILSWFLLKLSNSPALLADGLLRKPLACLCPWMDSHYYTCSLFIHLLITSLPIMVDVPRAGWGPIRGCEEPSLASWSAREFEGLHCLQLPLKMKAIQSFETPGSLILQHGFISQRNWIFTITAVRTSNLTGCY